MRKLLGGDLIFSAGVLGVVFILILPLPSMLLDMLLTANIALSVLILLTIAQIKRPVDFFAFPTVLLFVTLLRLGLNIATTRAILTRGDAGNMIDAFGDFVVQGNIVVGLIVFIILTIINFVVITKGAGRVAEVSARFTLDAMPGKQMSIDADLNSGVISEEEAKSRRRQIETEADFYGSMDGASKFVRGDAIAGILITTINIIAGFIVGILQMGMTPGDAMEKFTLLSVGDGLVAQIPALLVSTAAGVLVTRSGSSAGLGADLQNQLFASPKTAYLTGGLMFLMMLVPGFPTFVLLVLGAIFVAAGYFLALGEEEAAQRAALLQAEATSGVSHGGRPMEGGGGVPGGEQQPIIEKQKPEVLAVELGVGLLTLIHGESEGLVDRLTALKKSLSQELGIPVPKISIRDNTSLQLQTYQILLRGEPLATGELFPGQLMAMGVSGIQRQITGRQTREPAFGLPAVWINQSDKRQAERLGYTVVDPVSVMTTHVSQLLKTHAGDLLSRQDVQDMLDDLKVSSPALLQEVATLQINLGTIQRVLQNLLKEQVSVRNLSLILEKVCDNISITKNPDELAEAARKVLTLELARKCDLSDNKILTMVMDPELEAELQRGVRQTPQETAMVIDPPVAQHVHDQLKQGIDAMIKEGISPLLICSPGIRLGLKRFFGETFPNLKILAYNELPARMSINPVYSIAGLNGPGAQALGMGGMDPSQQPAT